MTKSSGKGSSANAKKDDGRDKPGKRHKKMMGLETGDDVHGQVTAIDDPNQVHIERPTSQNKPRDVDEEINTHTWPLSWAEWAQRSLRWAINPVARWWQGTTAPSSAVPSNADTTPIATLVTDGDWTWVRALQQEVGRHIITQVHRNLAADVLLHRMTQITHNLDNASPMATIARAESIREFIQRAHEYRDGHHDATVLMTVGGATGDELLFAADNLRQGQREQQHQLQPPPPVPRPTDPALLGALAQIAASIDSLGAHLGRCHDQSRQTQDTSSQSSDATVRPFAPEEDDPFWQQTSNNSRNTILGRIPNPETRSAGHDRNFLGLTPYSLGDWRLGSQPMTVPIPQAHAFGRRLTHPSLTPIGFERARRDMAGFMGGTLTSVDELAAQDGHLHVDRTRIRDAERPTSTTDRAQGLGIEVLPTPQLDLSDQTEQPTAQDLDDGQENPWPFRLGQTELVLRQSQQLVASLDDADAGTERAEEADQEEGRTVSGDGDEHVGPHNESVEQARSEDAEEEEIKAEEQQQEGAKQEGPRDEE